MASRKPKATDNSVAVIGMAGQFPGSDDIQAFWKNICGGKDGYQAFTDAELLRNGVEEAALKDENYVKSSYILGDIDKFDPAFFRISPSEAELMDPQIRLLLQCAWKALEDAGHASDQEQNVGVFAGMGGISTNYYSHFVNRSEQFQKTTASPTHLANDKDYLSTLISYKLNLTGPSMTIQSACSTSLVTVHQACLSLLNGECDMALAGGVNIRVPQAIGYQYKKGNIFSKTGHIKSFDESADGVVFGSGYGLVLLRKLGDALAANDHIYAVIKGSALTNDGKGKVSYGATTVLGQQRAIEKALRKADVPAHTISFVESHGTGTFMGDPIEITALTKAFASGSGEPPAKASCALGAVKTNVGHLDSASGIAGFIKAVLALHHKVIPPTLHFRKHNPRINFDSTPFFINKDLVEWKNGNGPRRAGVNSLGIGGTNAFVVLEEFVDSRVRSAAEDADGARKHVIPLSAKSEASLYDGLLALLAFLEEAAAEKRELSIADLAYTLQVGRQPMGYRAACCARDLGELKAWLQEETRGGFQAWMERRPAKAGEGKGPEDAFKEAAESGRWEDVARVWVGGTNLPWENLYQEASPRRLSLPSYCFKKDRFWASLSEPEEPGLGRLHPMLHGNVSDLSEQKYRSAFTGREPFLRDHQVHGEPILPGVAYLEMVREALAQSLPGAEDRVISLHDTVWMAPIKGSKTRNVLVGLYPDPDAGINCEISTEVDGQEAVHFQTRAKVEAASALPRLDLDKIRSELPAQSRPMHDFYEKLARRGLSYGPTHRAIRSIHHGDRQLLAKLVLAQDDGSLKDYGLHPGLMDGAFQASSCLVVDLEDDQDKAPPLPFALETARIFGRCQAEMFAWMRFSEGSKAGGNIVKLDMDLCDGAGKVLIQLRGFASRKLPAGGGKGSQRPDQTQTLFAAPQWEPIGFPGRKGGTSEAERHVLLFGLPEIRIAKGRCSSLAIEGDGVGGQYTGLSLVLMEYLKSILASKPKDRVLVQLAIPENPESAILAGVSGMLKTAALENPNLDCQLIRTDAKDEAEVLAHIQKAAAVPGIGEIRFSDGRAEKAAWKRLEWEPQGEPVSLQNHGVYLITGGLGKLGMICAREILMRCPQAGIEITGRHALAGARLEAFDALRAHSDRIAYRAVDLTSLPAVEKAVQDILRSRGKLTGIIHCAGGIQDSFLLKKTAGELDKVFAPKVGGLLHLDAATQDLDLDFLLLYSSVTSALGNVGQADYAAANGFMDRFAERRNHLAGLGRRKGIAKAIHWPLWKDGGMHVDPAAMDSLRRATGQVPMSSRTGLQAIHQALESPHARVMVMEGFLEEMERKVFPGTDAPGTMAVESMAVEIKAGRPEGRQLLDQALQFLKKEFSDLLKMPAGRIGDETPLEDYGINSMLVLDLTNKLEKTFGPLSKTLFFEYQTVRQLSEYFVEVHAGKLSALFGSPQEEGKDPAPAAAERAKESSRSVSFKAAAKARYLAPDIREAPKEQDLIAIVGLSGRYPQAAKVEDFWNNLRAGKDCIEEVPASRWDWREYFSEDRSKDGSHFSKWGGFIEGVDEFDPRFFNISAKEADKIDPQERLFLEHAWLAIEDAGYTRASLQIAREGALPAQVGVYAGVMYGEYQLLGAESSLLGNRTGFSSSLASIANRVSYFLNLHGPSMTVDTMCSSSLTAIHLACQDLKQGATDLGIAGGVNITIHPNKYLMLSEGQFISGAGHCQSFGEGGDGYIPGEGVGVAILKRLGDARRDGNHIYGIIRGSALGHGGKTNGYTVPNPQSQRDTVSRALRDAKVESGEITYIEAHGTGTKLGDPIEITALSKAFGVSDRPTGPCWLGSCKSNIGHCESAAGIAGLTKVLLQMKHGEIAPSLHSERLNPHIDFEATPFRVNQELRPWPRPEINGRQGRRIAGISSFGAGGSNAHLIIEEYVHAEAASEETQSSKVLIPLSARNAEQLSRKAADLLAFLEHRDAYPLRNMAYTLQVGREAMDERVVFSAASLVELKARLRSFAENQAVPDGAYRGQAKQNKETLSLFTEDEDMSATIQKWLANGKLEKIAQLWSRGYPLDWRQLYPQEKPEFVSLPGYPFAKERCWAIETSTHGSRKPAHSIHPLLHENVSDLDHTAFASEFSGHEAFCSQLSIDGMDRICLNGPAMLEMAIAAVMKATEKNGSGSSLELQEIVWGKPPVLSKPARVFITLVPESDNRILFEIHGGGKEGPVYCQGAALLDEAKEPAVREPGPGRIVLDIQSESGMDPESAYIDPGLLEKALHGVADRLPGRRLFPGRIGRMRFWKKAGKTATARILIRPTDSDVSLDLEILDTEGRPSCAISDLAYPVQAAAKPEPPSLVSALAPEISLEPLPAALPAKPEGVFLLDPILEGTEVSGSAIARPMFSLSDPAFEMDHPSPSSVAVSEGEEGIHWITVRTSMNQEVIADLLSVLGRLGKEDGLRALVIQGSSETFLSGGLEELNRAIGSGLFKALSAFPLPVIACMQGNAYGPGLLAAMVCDFMVAAEDRQYGLADCRNGLSGEAARLIEYRIGHAKSQCLLGTDALPGAEFAEKGFAHKVVAGDRVRDQAGRLAAKLAAKTKDSLKLLKGILGRKLAEHVEALSPAVAEAESASGTISIRISQQADAESVQRELAQAFGKTGIRTMVLESEHPDFLPSPTADKNLACIRFWQDRLSRTALHIIAAPAGDLHGYGWICAQLAQEVVYHAAGKYSLSEIRDSDSLQHACEVFSLRLGASLGREIVLTGRTYSGRELQARVQALTVVGSAPSLPFAPGTTLSFQGSEVVLDSKAVSATAYPDGVLLVRLQERESKNMFSQAFVEGLKEAFRHIEGSEAYKSVVLTGFDNYFASGGTKESLLAIQEGKVKFTDDRIYHLAAACKVPVISAIQGHAIGAGWALGMFADLAVLSEESKYLSPYMEYGFTPGAGATLILPETLGQDLAKETLYVAEELSGEDLKKRGAPVPVVPRSETVNHALAIAHDMARLTRDQLIALKSRWTAELFSRLDSAYDAELSAHEGTLVGKQDARNRIEAVFLTEEKKASSMDGAARQAKPAGLQAPREPVSGESLLATMRKLLADELRMPMEELDLDTQFVDMGLDSISGVTWIRKINEAYGTAIEATRIYSHPTLKDLGAFIHQEAAKLPAKEGSGAPPLRVEEKPAVQAGPAGSQPAAPAGFSAEARFPVLESRRRSGSKASRRRDSSSPSTEPIAVIGMAGQFPMSPDLDAFWNNLASGVDCVTEIRSDRWDMQPYFQKGEPAPGKTYSKWMGALENYDRFDPAFFNISPREAVGMDPQQRLFLQNCWHAIESAGYDPKSLSGSRCGIFVGCAAGDYGSSAREYQWSAQGFTGGNMSILSARIAYFLNLQGPCLSIETACSSSLVAIATGCDSLSMGSCDTVLAGGVNVFSGPGMHVKTAQTAMLSPDGKCFTFDSRANGFVPGEGVGVVMLKRLSAAERDGDNILGVIRGWGVNQDGTTNGITAPNGDSQTRLEREVYDRFRIEVEDIQLIEAHGTGTKLGDPIEVTALKDAFKAYTGEKRYCAIGSVKSNIGHCLAAAGVSGFIKALLSLQNQQLPPTIHYDKLNEHISLGDSPFYVNSTLREWKAKGDRPRLAAVSAFGFSGTNAHLVLSEYRGKAPAPAAQGEYLIPLSARNRERLRDKAADLLKAIRNRAGLSIADLAFTLQVGRTAMEERVGFVVDSLEGLRKALEAYIAGKSDANRMEGGAQGNNEALALLQTDEDLQGTVARWMAESRWRKLLQVWVKGLSLDWRKLNQGRPARKVPLPGYPFARDRYWLDETSFRRGPASLPEAGMEPVLAEVPEIETYEPEIPEPAAPEAAGTASPTRLRDELVSSLASCLFLDPADIQDDKPFVEMGLDSVIGVEWIQRINKQFKINLSATKIYEHPSIAQISGYLHGLLAGEGAVKATPVNGKSGAHHEPAPVVERNVQAPAPDRTESLEQIQDFLILSLSQELYLRETDIEVGKAFVEMGMDSIIGVEWVKKINQKFALKITATRIYEHPNIQELAAHILKEFPVPPALEAPKAAPAPKPVHSRAPAPIRPAAKAMEKQGRTLINKATRTPEQLKSQWQSVGAPYGFALEAPTLSMDSLGFRKWEVPPVGPDEIKVQVMASAVNFPDALCVSGLYPTMPPYPFVPGFEVSGVVVEKGRSVTRFDIGDAVIALTGKEMGGHASLVNVPEDSAIRKPAHISFEQGCSLPVAFCTAHYAYEIAGLKAGEWVLVHTATGGVGLLGLQLAAMRGARIIASSSKTGKLALLRELGVAAIDYRGQFDAEVRALTQGRGADVVFNMLSGKAIQLGLDSLAPSGRYLEIAVQALKASERLDLSNLVSNQSFHSIDLRRLITGAHPGFRISDILKDLETFLSDSAIAPIVSRIYPIHRLAEAIGHVSDGSHIGKVVISHTSDQLIDTTEECRQEIKRILSRPSAKPARQGKGNAAKASDTRIAVIGAAGQFPKSKDLDAFWKNLANGENCISEVPERRWSGLDFYSGPEVAKGKTNSKWMGALEDADAFDPLFFNISPTEARAMDPQQRLFLQACWNSIENAGYNPQSLWGAKCGVFVGGGHGDYHQISREERLKGEGLMGGAASILPARFSYFLNLKGPSVAMDTACSSSLVALCNACDNLVSGTCDTALAGGVYVMSTPLMHIQTAQSGMLSKDGRCYTFDQRANGFVPGEAVGVVFLKRLEDAERDGDTIQAVISGWGVNQDGKTNGITAPNPESQSRLEMEVYRRFGIDPEDIQMVEAHGTGTKLGDPIEVEALKTSFKAFTRKTGYCALGSVKSNIGHCMSAAGISGVMKVLLSLRHRQIPPTVNFEKLNEHIDLENSPFFVNTRLLDWEVRAGRCRQAVVSSFGFSGTNVHVVLSEHQAKPAAAAAAHPTTAIIPLSARTQGQLGQMALDLAGHIGAGNLSLEDLAYTLQVGRMPMEHRLALVASSLQDLKQQLLAYAQGRKTEGMHAGTVVQGKRNAKDKDQKGRMADLLRDKDWQALAEAWTQGVDLDWARLYPGRSPRRAILPSYPFAKERYWLRADGLEGVGGASAGRIHPLVHENISNLRESRHRSILDGKDSLLRDHRIRIHGEDGQVVLSGAALLEMARFAARNSFGPSVEDKGMELQNVVWLAPLILDNPTPVSIHLLDEWEEPDGRQGAFFSITSAEGDAETVHCEGEVRFSGPKQAPSLDILKLAGRMDRDRFDGAYFYARLAQMGMLYGATHRLVERIKVGADEVLAELRVEGSLPGGLEYPPGLVDGILQSSLCLIADLRREKQAPLPLSIDGIRFLGPLEPELFCWSRPSGERSKIDIDVCGRNGLVLLQIIGLESRKAPEEADRTTHGDFDEGYYLDLIGRIQRRELSISDAASIS